MIRTYLQEASKWQIGNGTFVPLSFQDNFPDFTYEWMSVLAVLVISAIAIMYLVKPMNRIRYFWDIGWNHLTTDDMTRRTKLEIIKEAQRRRKIGDIPPVFPNGWFVVEESRLLKIGEVRPVSVLGESLVLFRAEDGLSHVLDAHCPHLGANMAVGGVIKGNCIQCPFHGWMFEGKTGRCASIPYANKVPDFANVRPWITTEQNGLIFIWYDAEGRSPYYTVPLIPEISSNLWKYRGRSSHQVLSHIQEIPENGSDIAHLGYLHVPNILKGVDLTTAFRSNWIWDIVHHHWEGEWGVDEGSEGSHISNVKLKHSFSFFNGLFKMIGISVSAHQNTTIAMQSASNSQSSSSHWCTWVTYSPQ